VSRIGRLIQEQCPGGVERAPLGEVGDFIRGMGILKSDLTAEGSPAIHYGQIHTTYGVSATETVSFVAPALAARLRKARHGDLVIATTSEDDEAVAKATAWEGTAEAAVSSDAHIYRHTLVPRYVAYFFQTRDFHEQKMPRLTGTKVRRISSESLERILIPVPPALVQEEVVRVLDAFQNLGTDLEAELVLRRRQMAHYRERLMTFPDGVRRRPIGKIGDIFRGRRFTKADYVEDGGVGCIHYGEIYTDYGTKATATVSRIRADLAPTMRFATKGDVVLTDVGETVEDVGKAVAWMGAEDVAVHDHCYVFRSDLNPAFISHYMQTARFRADKDPYIARTKVKTLLPAGLPKILLPEPPREEQDRIVAILDAFDALINDSDIGLPAEIAGRRRQFEHYRDRLFAFHEAAP
jgi:type I restriction enzyme S subunit